MVDGPRSQFGEAVQAMRLGLKLSNLDQFPMSF
jgi:hypothetical protein